MNGAFRWARAAGGAAALMIGFAVVITAAVGFVHMVSFHLGITRDAAMVVLAGFVMFAAITYILHHYGTE